MYFIVWTSFTNLNWNLISTSAKYLKHSQGKLQCDSLFELMAWFRQTCLFFLLHLTTDPKKAFAAGLSPKKALKSECNYRLNISLLKQLVKGWMLNILLFQWSVISATISISAKFLLILPNSSDREAVHQLSPSFGGRQAWRPGRSALWGCRRPPT